MGFRRPSTHSTLSRTETNTDPYYKALGVPLCRCLLSNTTLMSY